MVDHDTDRTPIEKSRERWLTAMRLAMIGVGISIAALLVGAISIGTWAAQVRRDGERNSWNDMTRAHDTCISASNTRNDTITLEHGRFDREASSIDADEATIDLIEANVLTLISFAHLPADHPVVVSSAENIATRRARLQDDRDALAAAITEFDQKRPPLDRALCPAAPKGPRP